MEPSTTTANRVGSATRARAPNVLFSPDALRSSIAFVAGRAPALLLPVVIAARLGATAATDRMFLALAVSTYIVGAIGATTESVAVPYLVRERQRGSSIPRRLRQLEVSVGAAGLVAIGLVAAVVAIAAQQAHMPPWVPDPWAILAVSPLVLLGSVASTVAGALYATRRYAVATSSYGLRALGALVVVAVVGKTLGPMAVIAGLTAGVLAQVVVLRSLVRADHTPPGSVPPLSTSLRPFASQAAWQLGGSLAVGFVPLADRVSAAALATGSISILEYIERLWLAPVNLFISGALIVCLTEWSSLQQTPRRLVAAVRHTACWVLAVSVPLVVVGLAARGPIMELLLGWGAFPGGRLAEAASTWAAMLAGTPLYLVSLLYAKALIASRRTRWIFLVAIVQLAAKLLLNSILAPAMGIAGIALASSLVYALACGLLVMLVHRGDSSSDTRPT